MLETSPILVPSRSLCHALFGGSVRFAVARSGRRVMGVEKINHGRTPAYAEAPAGRRTGFTNVRDGKEISRFAKRKRGASVLVCGSNDFVVKGKK